MSLAIDIVLAGVVLGGMYALVAMGLTLQYGGARPSFAVAPLIGVLIAIPVGFAINWLVYEIILMPLVKRARNRAMLEVDSILATFGILFVVKGIMLRSEEHTSELQTH